MFTFNPTAFLVGIFLGWVILHSLSTIRKLRAEIKEHDLGGEDLVKLCYRDGTQLFVVNILQEHTEAFCRALSNGLVDMFAYDEEGEGDAR